MCNSHIAMKEKVPLLNFQDYEGFYLYEQLWREWKTA